jgi:hypothetical protein
MAAPQRGGEQRQHPPHHLLGERRPGPDRVRAQEVDLELGRILGGDAHVLELPEAGGHPVHRRAGRERRLHHGPPGGDPLAVAVVQGRRRGTASDGLELGEGGHAPERIGSTHAEAAGRVPP